MELKTQREAEMLPQSASRIHQVTPLSKYLAMALFIVLPFVGAYLGYTLAPGKVVEVEKEVISEAETENKTPGFKSDTELTYADIPGGDSRIPYQEFIEVDAENYPTINKQYFIDNPSDTLQLVSDDTGVRRALRLSDTKLLLMAASSYNMHVAYLVYDETTSEVVSEVSFPTMSLYTWYDDSKVVAVAGQANKIQITDYLNDNTIVLYEESDPNVQLVEVWEMGQTGKLEVEEDTVVFGRYRKLPGTTATEFIEEVRVPIPQSFISE